MLFTSFIVGLILKALAVAVVIAVIEITLSVIEAVLKKLSGNNYHLLTDETKAITIDIDRLSKETGVNQRRSLGVHKEFGRVNLLVNADGEAIAGEVIESDSTQVQDEIIIYDL